MSSRKCDRCPLRGDDAPCFGEGSPHVCALAGTDGGDRHVRLRSAVAGGWTPPVPAYSPPPAYPSLARQALNLASSVASHVAGGMAAVDDAERARRMATCKSCPSYDAEAVRCRECGCGMRLKARWASSSCPLGKW